MRVDTAILGPIIMGLAIIGFVLSAKGYLTPWVSVPLIWVGAGVYLSPRTVFQFERKTRGV